MSKEMSRERQHQKLMELATKQLFQQPQTDSSENASGSFFPWEVSYVRVGGAANVVTAKRSTDQ
jgi:hypothetical protein